MSYRRYGDEKDYNFPSSEEGDFIDRQTNDARLQKAIYYLTHEGDEDATKTYIDRIGLIDKNILQQFPIEGRSYNPKLYLQLQSLVREVQSDLQQIDEEESSSGLGGDSSVEELMSPETLYREASPVEVKDSRKVFEDKQPSLTSSEGHVREVSFKYGGPRNEVEEWHKELPPVLPFGENPYMEKWESMKINYDLRESLKRSADDAEPVTTNVPYKAVEYSGGFIQQDIYDSGSRYKLPARLLKALARFGPAFRQDVWDGIIDAFNGGGPLQKEKKYVPRVALPRVELDLESLDSAPMSGKEPINRPSDFAEHARSSASFEEYAGPSTTRRTSRTGTIGPALHTRLPEYQQRQKSAVRVTTTGPSQPRRGPESLQTVQINPGAQPRLKKLDATRKAAGARDAAYATHPAMPKVSDSLTPAERPKPMPPVLAPKVQRLAYVEARSSTRKHGRSRKLPVDPTYIPVSEDPSPVTPIEEIIDDDLLPATLAKRKYARRKGNDDPAYKLSPVSPSKRARDENLDYHESSTKRAKAGTKVSSRAALKLGPKQVAFRGREISPARKSTPNNQATPKKSGLKKFPPKPKLKKGNPESNQQPPPAVRGTTRTGQTFKPAGLRWSFSG